MKSALLFIASFTFFNVFAQEGKRITYSLEIRFGTETLEAVIKEVENERDDIDSAKRIQLEEIAKGMVDFINDEANGIIQAWREGAWVITREMSSAEGKISKHYHVESLAFRVIDSFTYKAISKIDTFQTSMNYRANKDWGVSYSVIKTKQRRKILNYKCRLFKIKESRKTDEDGVEERNFSIWATKKIKPSISTHAVLGLYDTILIRYTPLEAEEISSKMPGTFQRLKAIRIH